ncbi:type II 3-dehydroquinate dehydratase [Microbacterium sp. G2-8]|uniref:type II 3-dehydroquinate dehydratase n=1 Tax=Microbacterium sp. G2-8 TaxID=2842454 RepID=UPI001C89684B|nr:type II 3-dehydroquinate dehydratase [Microbacterium sp. G2-8]
MNKRILVVNGPNLNLLGTRQPDLYGSDTLADVEALVGDVAGELGFEVRCVQSNSEGALVDAIHAARESCDAIVINAGAYTHTSVAIRDALQGVDLPFAEVHVTNVYAREPFRHHSFLSDVATCVIAGAGIRGYEFAVRQLVATLA